jgi:hypothetical protein
MNRNIKLFFALTFSALLVTMCRFYDAGERVTPINGLSCQGYTDYFGKGAVVSKGLECYYTCQQEVAGPLDFETDPSLSASKEDLDRTLCSVTAPQSTPTEPVASASATLAASATAPASPTTASSPTAAISPTALMPLLTGEITMCDGGLKLISFRIVQPPPDLTDKTLTVQIAGRESSCTVNPVNTSLLTCSIPRSMAFPAQVVVQLDGALVNDFSLDGVGCINIDPPTSTPVP